jgi:hypothetical protein
MNLQDILIPNNPFYKRLGAESADCAESQSGQGLLSPQVLAETCGKRAELGVVRSNPLVAADSTGQATIQSPHNPHNPHHTAVEIEKPLPVTVEYFSAQGVELLREDLAFLLWLLPKGTASRNKVIREYILIWLEVVDSEPLSHKKANRGRFAANTWLRELGR